MSEDKKIENNAEVTTPVIDDNELAVAEREAEKSTNIYTHKFATPFKCEDKVYDELTFDWGALKGKDCLSIENEMASLGIPLITPEFSGEFLIRMAAHACTEKIGHDVLREMPLGDYNKVRGRARSFLMRSGR